jgi:hypothetical protein
MRPHLARERSEWTCDQGMTKHAICQNGRAEVYTTNVQNGARLNVADEARSLCVWGCLRQPNGVFFICKGHDKTSLCFLLFCLVDDFGGPTKGSIR